MLNILYQFNEEYAPYAVVSVCSLLENNKDVDTVHLYALLDNVQQSSRERLYKQVKKYGARLTLIDAAPIVEKLKELGVNDYRGSYATNLKLFLSDFISDTVDRILYIDCDTLIAGNLAETMRMDMGGMPVAMVLDSMCVSHKRALGFRENENYFNAGIILFDVKRWKEQKCTEQIVTHLQTERSVYMAPDQDILNLVLRDSIAVLQPRYNMQPLHFVYNFKLYKKYWYQSNYYSEREIGESMNDLKIIHFFRYLGQFPWHQNALHPHTDAFDCYLTRSEWSDYRKKPTQNNDLVFKAERWLYKVLPQKLFLPLFKMAHEMLLARADRASLKNLKSSRV